MRQQQFGLQARRFHAFFGQKIRALLNGFENRHAANLNQNDVLEQVKPARQNWIVNARMNLLFAAVLLGSWVVASCADNSKTAKEPAMNIQITSTAFSEGQPIPQKHTCQGSDFSPPLAWTNTPPNTKSFALIVDDPDAPAGTWVHWVIYDLPATATGLAENTPKSAQLPGGVK